MTPFDAIRDLTEFYLLPFYPTKDIELVQFKVNRKLNKLQDELLQKVAAFAETIRLVGKMRRAIVEKNNLEVAPDERLYLELLKLTPADLFNVIGSERYGLTDRELSLILKLPVNTVRFRRQQLIATLKDDGHSILDFKKLSPQAVMSTSSLRIFRGGLAGRPLTGRKTLGRPGDGFASTGITRKFRTLPFGARFALETSGVIAVLVLLMWIIPEIRNTYETSIQKRINDYLIEASLVDSPAPAGTTKEAKPLPSPDANAPSEEEMAAEAAEASAPSKKQPKVVEGETWRFSFTGSQTTDIENGVETILHKLDLEQKPLTVPGGIQFDVTVPVSQVLQLKSELEDMTSQIQRKSGGTKQALLSSANLSWYKKRNMGTRKIPSAHVQAIVWISTL